jgi:hypothetical protein
MRIHHVSSGFCARGALVTKRLVADEVCRSPTPARVAADRTLVFSLIRR